MGQTLKNGTSHLSKMVSRTQLCVLVILSVGLVIEAVPLARQRRGYYPQTHIHSFGGMGGFGMPFGMMGGPFGMMGGMGGLGMMGGLGGLGGLGFGGLGFGGLGLGLGHMGMFGHRGYGYNRYGGYPRGRGGWR